MKRFGLLVLVLFTVLSISCKHTFKVKETFAITAPKDSLDKVLQRIGEKVKKIDNKGICEKVYQKYPDALKQYVAKTSISYGKVTKHNLNTGETTSNLKLEVIMEYDASQKQQAKEIVKYYAGFVTAVLN